MRGYTAFYISFVHYIKGAILLNYKELNDLTKSPTATDTNFFQFLQGSHALSLLTYSAQKDIRSYLKTLGYDETKDSITAEMRQSLETAFGVFTELNPITKPEPATGAEQYFNILNSSEDKVEDEAFCLPLGQAEYVLGRMLNCADDDYDIGLNDVERSDVFARVDKIQSSSEQNEKTISLSIYSPDLANSFPNLTAEMEDVLNEIRERLGEISNASLHVAEGMYGQQKLVLTATAKKPDLRFDDQIDCRNCRVMAPSL